MAQRPTLLCPRGMVVAEHYLAAEAGLRMLHAGGNACDAAVAATLVEGVVNPHMYTFGGELSALLYTAHDRRVLAVNGNTKAPRAATIEWFRDHGLALIPMAVFGTQGGDQQDQWTLQVFLNLVVFDREVQEAIEAARFSSLHFPSSFFPHHASPGGLRIEGRVPEAVCAELARRGHVVAVDDDWVAGDVLCIRVDEERGVLRGGEISRRMPSYAIGW